MDKVQKTEKLCLNVEDIPKEPHFAIIVFDTRLIATPERYQGYCDSKKDIEHEIIVTHYYSYKDQKEWEYWIRKCVADKKKFVAIRSKPVKIEVKTKIS